MQGDPINASVPQECILGHALFLLYINDFPDNVIFNIVISVNDMILYSKSGWASVLWRRLELACELESNPQDCFTGLVRPILDLCLVRLEYPIY